MKNVSVVSPWWAPTCTCCRAQQLGCLGKAEPARKCFPAAPGPRTGSGTLWGFCGSVNFDLVLNSQESSNNRAGLPHPHPGASTSPIPGLPGPYPVAPASPSQGSRVPIPRPHPRAPAFPSHIPIPGLPHFHPTSPSRVSHGSHVPIPELLVVSFSHLLSVLHCFYLFISLHVCMCF